MNMYEKCPYIENDRWIIRQVNENDCEDLLEVYSDKNALPFFNSDNCNGDNFYYATKERMQEALNFWKQSFENEWFTRLSIVDKSISKVIGTFELCLRVSDDNFNQMGILRLDVKSNYEQEKILTELFQLILSVSYDAIGCTHIITKAPIYAIERIKALQHTDFSKSEHYLIGGHDRYAYDHYWVRSQITSENS